MSWGNTFGNTLATKDMLTNLVLWYPMHKVCWKLLRVFSADYGCEKSYVDKHALITSFLQVQEEICRLNDNDHNGSDHLP